MDFKVHVAFLCASLDDAPNRVTESSTPERCFRYSNAVRFKLQKRELAKARGHEQTQGCESSKRDW